MYIRKLVVTVVLLSLTAAVSLAQDNLPSAKEVLSRNIKEMGGKDAFEKVKTITIKGKIEMSGIKGDMEISFMAPRQLSVVVDLEGVGQQRQGINGDVAWEISPILPPRLMKKDEAARLLQEMDLTLAYKPETVYKSMKNAGIEEIAGTKCYKLELKRAGSDEPDLAFIALDSGLTLKSVTTRPTSQGPLKIETTVKKYKEFGGLQSPVQMEQNLLALGMVQHVSIDSVEYNKKIAEEKFSLPGVVKELVKKARISN